MTAARQLLSLALAATALCAANAANAATVTLTPSVTSVVQNEIFTASLTLDASDVSGSDPGLFMGQVRVQFDPAEIAYESFVFQSPVTQQYAPLLDSNDGLQAVQIGFYNAGDVATIGTFTFRATGSVGTLASLGVADADDFFGTFISKLPTDQPFQPAFTGATISIAPVPLPAAGWMFLTGLGLAGWRGVRRTRA